MEYFFYLVYRGAEAGLSMLPLRVAMALGRGIGTALYYFAWPYRRLVRRNLEIAFRGEKEPGEIKQLVRQHFAALGENLFASMKVATMPLVQSRGLLKVENHGIVLESLKAGRGVILIITHTGNWELLTHLPLHVPADVEFATVYQPLGNKYLDAYVKKSRERFGVVAFDRRQGFSAPLALLRRGSMLGVLVDQHAGDSGVWTPLFRRLASTSPLAAALASRTGAALIPVAIRRSAPGHWKMVFSPPLDQAGLCSEQLSAVINLAVEEQVRVAPPDWFWMHDRWKTPQPDFLVGHYKRGVALPPGMATAGLQPFQILIRSTNWLGDAVMSAPAVRALKAGRPDARITVLAPEKLVDFWAAMPEVHEVIPRRARDGLLSVARKLRRDFDAAFIFPNSVRAALEVYLAGVPRRVGYRRPWRTWLINDVVPERATPGPFVHEVRHYLKMAEHVGAKHVEDFMPRLADVTVAGQWIGICPGAEYGPAKRWLPERFAAAAETVRQRTGLGVRLFGVEKDRAIGEEIARALGGQCENLIGRTTLAELIPRLRECRVLLTNDTGTMHLAAHLGVSVVAVFGSTEPAATGPLGAHAAVLRQHVPCSPCFLRECPLDLRCMKAISADAATRAVLERLRAAELPTPAPEPGLNS